MIDNTATPAIAASAILYPTFERYLDFLSAVAQDLLPVAALVFLILRTIAFLADRRKGDPPE